MISTDLPLILPQWDAPSNIVAYSTTRNGGQSDANYASLNVGFHVNDNATKVALNRRRLPKASSICWMNQIHGAKVCKADKSSAVPTCDGLYSHQSNIYCAVMTADCIPLLITSKHGDEVAAIHAGWKGLQLGVINHAVTSFKCLPQDLIAWIGPTISASNYEVDNKVKAHFPAFQSAFVENNRGGYQFSLTAVAEIQLHRAGVDSVVNSGLCTYQNEQQFFSYRRSTHQGQQQCGRQVAVIGFS